MRSKLVFGSVLAYVAMAFVPPSQQNVLVHMQSARADIASTARGALVQEEIPSEKELKAAATLMQELAKNPQIGTLIHSAEQKAGVHNGTAVIGRAAGFLAAISPSVKPARSPVQPTSTIKVTRSTSWKKMVSTETVPALRDLLQQVDFAQRKGDIRLCRDFDPSLAGFSGVRPTAGDFLALCLAKVTGEVRRCEQISLETAPQLRSVCSSELVGRATHALVSL